MVRKSDGRVEPNVDVSIIIVTYNGREITFTTLARTEPR